MMTELIVHVSQPLVRITRELLRLIAKEHHDVALLRSDLRHQAANQVQPFVGIGELGHPAARPGRDEQGTEKGTFIGNRVIVAGHPHGEHRRTDSREVQTQIVDGVSFSHPRSGIDQGAGDQESKTALDEIGECLDRCGRHAIIADIQRVFFSVELCLCHGYAPHVATNSGCAIPDE